MGKWKMTARSKLKKYAHLHRYSCYAYSTGSFLKHLAMKFKFSEFELNRAHQQNKITIDLGEYKREDEL
jgi:hypothetical protein